MTAPLTEYDRALRDLRADIIDEVAASMPQASASHVAVVILRRLDAGLPVLVEVDVLPEGLPTISAPTCSTCNDTHSMTQGDRDVMCTRCPVPCGLCRSKPQGAYCATTPCTCPCHARHARKDAP